MANIPEFPKCSAIDMPVSIPVDLGEPYIHGIYNLDLQAGLIKPDGTHSYSSALDFNENAIEAQQTWNRLFPILAYVDFYAHAVVNIRHPEKARSHVPDPAYEVGTEVFRGKRFPVGARHYLVERNPISPVFLTAEQILEENVLRPDMKAWLVTLKRARGYLSGNEANSLYRLIPKDER